jgi:CheY-like chemotaxis protein
VRLEQIVCNLVNNAAKFSPQPDEIRVETSEQAGYAQLAVADRGIGFDPAEATRLFDPFIQVNPSLARNAGGLGMGLTIVKRLVELHGGSVEAASAGLGKGARFVVRLPLAGASEEAGPEAQRAPMALRRRSIVVIEDNPDIRDTLQMLLEIWGHEFEMAHDGPTGLELVLRKRPQVALIDIGLPGMNGYDVARAIRARTENAAIRLIAVTGYGQPSDRDLALEAGFDTHLLKPIKPEILASMLGEY